MQQSTSRRVFVDNGHVLDWNARNSSVNDKSYFVIGMRAAKKCLQYCSSSYLVSFALDFAMQLQLQGEYLN